MKTVTIALVLWVGLLVGLGQFLEGISFVIAGAAGGVITLGITFLKVKEGK